MREWAHRCWLDVQTDKNWQDVTSVSDYSGRNWLATADVCDQSLLEIVNTALTCGGRDALSARLRPRRCHIADVSICMHAHAPDRVRPYDIPCQSTGRLGQWAETKHCWLSVRPATSAYLKIRWHHCCVSIFLTSHRPACHTSSPI